MRLLQVEPVEVVDGGKRATLLPAAGFELAFVTDDPHTAYATAITAGAAAIAPPAEKPWGQVVAYVRDPNGCLVEICSPIGS